MNIKYAVTEKEKNELDQLLWNVLWKPLGLPRDTRQSFKLNYPQIELIAIDNGNVIGGIVANWLSDDEIEIHHIAVSFDYQGRSVGKRLVGKLIELVELDVPITIHTYARNTSASFFSKLGFIPTGEYLEHPDFAKHGIAIQKMYCEIREKAENTVSSLNSNGKRKIN